MDVWSPELEQKYLKMYGGSKADVERIKKTYKQNVELDPRIEFLLFVYSLQNADYPIKGNQLKIYQWEWLAELKQAIKEIQHEQWQNRT